MPMPAADWFERLPVDRLITEFSLWSADLTRLADEITRIEPWADLLHIDAADGHFAAVLLLFPDLVARIRQRTALPIHVHLMVHHSVLMQQIQQFADAGADLITFHLESGAFASETLDFIASLGIKAGMALEVETPVAQLAPFLDRLHAVSLLGAQLGVRGQGLDPMAPRRVTEARTMIGQLPRPHRIVLTADAGIRNTTVPTLREAGADSVILGSMAFTAPDLDALMGELRHY